MLFRLASAADVPATALTGGVRTELFENRELLVENHRGILEYGEQIIRIDCGELVMKIEGVDMCIAAMSRSGLSLKGRFLSISYSTP